MQVISLKCPSCGANFKVSYDKVRCFCSHCGTQILIDDGIKRSINVDINRTKEKELEAKMALYNEEVASIKKKTKRLKLSLIFTIPLTIILSLICTYVYINYDKEIAGIFGMSAMCVGMFIVYSIIEINSEHNEIEQAGKILEEKKPFINIDFGNLFGKK